MSKLKEALRFAVDILESGRVAPVVELLTYIADNVEESVISSDLQELELNEYTIGIFYDMYKYTHDIEEVTEEDLIPQPPEAA